MPVLDQLKKMSPERFLAIYTSLENRGFGPLDGEVAKSLRFRPQGVKKLSMEQRARRAKALLESSRNAELAYELFGAYLLRHQKGIVTGFLDSTGVPHQEGMIDDLDGAKPAPEKLEAALADLDGRFPAEDVTLYLSMCAEQWPSVAEIGAAWRARYAAP